MSMNIYAYPGLYQRQKTELIFYTKKEKAQYITKVVCEFFQKDPNEILTQSHKRELVIVRHIAIYFVKLNTTLILISIGELFNRHYTSVIYAIQAVNDLIDTDKKFKQNIADIKVLLKEIKKDGEFQSDVPTVGSN